MILPGYPHAGLLRAGPVPTGVLSGSRAVTTAAANLTSLGSIDFRHFTAASSSNRKSTGGSLISTLSGGSSDGTDSAVLMSYSDGTPANLTSSPNFALVVSNAVLLQFTVPSYTSNRVLRVWYGATENSTVSLTASISDGSSSDLVLADTTPGGGNTWYLAEITYRAITAGTLTVSIARGLGFAHLIQGAALSS